MPLIAVRAAGVLSLALVRHWRRGRSMCICAACAYRAGAALPLDRAAVGDHIADIDPALIRAAAAAKTLPLVAEPVSADARLRRTIEDVLHRPDDPADELATTWVSRPPTR